MSVKTISLLGWSMALDVGLERGNSASDKATDEWQMPAMLAGCLWRFSAAGRKI